MSPLGFWVCPPPVPRQPVPRGPAGLRAACPRSERRGWALGSRWEGLPHSSERPGMGQRRRGKTLSRAPAGTPDLGRREVTRCDRGVSFPAGGWSQGSAPRPCADSYSPPLPAVDDCLGLKGSSPPHSCSPSGNRRGFSQRGAESTGLGDSDFPCGPCQPSAEGSEDAGILLGSPGPGRGQADPLLPAQGPQAWGGDPEEMGEGSPEGPQRHTGANAKAL